MNISKILLSLIFLLLFPLSAYAQNCQNLDKNKQWTEGLQYVKGAVETKSWDDALNKARELVQICNTSPMLNYYISIALREKGDKIKSLQYIQKASDDTFTFATAPEAARLIWYARHDAEFPERTESAQNELNQANKDLRSMIETHQQSQKEDLGIGLWTGVSVAAAGIALTTAGAVLAFKDDDNVIDPNSSHALYDGENLYIKGKTTTQYQAGLIMFGAGLAATFSGTLLTAIFGYKYTHIKNNLQLTAGFSPQHIHFSMTF